MKTVSWPRAVLPALEQNRFLVATNITNFVEVPGSNISLTFLGYIYRTTNTQPQQFYSLNCSS